MRLCCRDIFSEVAKIPFEIKKILTMISEREIEKIVGQNDSAKFYLFGGVLC